jgi:hypothetical protein
MKKTYKKGDHFQQVGGYKGIAFDGKTWIRYDCSGCALASGLTFPGQRLPIANNSKIWDKYFRNADYNTIIRHDIKLHNAWITAGKPLPFIQE